LGIAAKENRPLMFEDTDKSSRELIHVLVEIPPSAQKKVPCKFAWTLKSSGSVAGQTDLSGRKQQ
jgi:hypothetical protein